MTNYKLIIMYDGTNYSGWQRQKNADSIQQRLEDAISIITRTKATVIGASRTDAGVHAKNYTANVFLNAVEDSRKLLYSLNALLPQDIKVKEIKECDADFNARFDAVKKTYIYSIDNAKYADVFSLRYMWHVKQELNFEKMSRAAEFFEGKHDFSSFAAAGGSSKTFEREIYSCKLIKEDEKFFIKVCGNGFLYNMIRIMAGTLVLVGKEKLEPEDIKKIIAFKDRKKAGMTAPPHGLCLYNVNYKDE